MRSIHSHIVVVIITSSTITNVLLRYAGKAHYNMRLYQESGIIMLILY